VPLEVPCPRGQAGVRNVVSAVACGWFATSGTTHVPSETVSSYLRTALGETPLAGPWLMTDPAGTVSIKSGSVEVKTKPAAVMAAAAAAWSRPDDGRNGARAYRPDIETGEVRASTPAMVAKAPPA